MKRLALLIILSAIAVVSVAFLFSWSEKIIHYQNNFTRRYPPHAVQEVRRLDMVYNSYYFAGSHKNKLYLGNYTAPLQMTVIDTTLKIKTIHEIELREKNLPFHSPQVRVLGNNFFVFEGTVPYIFKGLTTNWKAQLALNSGQTFSQLEPLSDHLFAVRFDAPQTGQNLLGTIDLQGQPQTIWNDSLLKKQIDGIFDTDGSLHVNTISKELIYVHRYRNEFTVADSKARLKYRGNTIDTITKAQIKLETVQDGRKTTMAAPPLIVNRLSAVGNELLFVNSTLPGKNENLGIWKSASIIDVYDLKTKAYQGSVPIYKIDGKRIRALHVSGKHLFALVDNTIVSYIIRDHLTPD